MSHPPAPLSSLALILRLLPNKNQTLPVHCGSYVGVWIISIFTLWLRD